MKYLNLVKGIAMMAQDIMPMSHARVVVVRNIKNVVR
jgi:hypothetical protein